METYGRLVIGFGLILVLVGGLMLLLGRLGLPPLPGDVSFRLGGVHVVLPLGTSILLSIVLTLVLNLLVRR